MHACAPCKPETDAAEARVGIVPLVEVSECGYAIAATKRSDSPLHAYLIRKHIASSQLFLATSANS
jgi:hypothetical protein